MHTYGKNVMEGRMVEKGFTKQDVKFLSKQTSITKRKAKKALKAYLDYLLLYKLTNENIYTMVKSINTIGIKKFLVMYKGKNAMRTL